MVVHDLQWPEVPTSDAHRLALAKRIVERLMVAVPAPVGFVLVPDLLTASERRALETSASAGGRVFAWGGPGLAVATDDQALAARLVRELLDSSADQLTVIARPLTEPSSVEQLARFVERLLVPPMDSEGMPAFVGLLFDWGAPIKTLDSHGFGPVGRGSE